MNWQPIETAPKDGTWILLAGGETDDEAEVRSIVAAQWAKEMPPSGRWHFAWYDGGFYGKYLNPTHWMPLPPAPEAK